MAAVFLLGIVRDQRHGIVPDRRADDAAHRTCAAWCGWRLSAGNPIPTGACILVVGVLGGYTTFSSFEYETYRAVRDGARWVGLLYVTGSVIVGYLGVWLGAVSLATRRWAKKGDGMLDQSVRAKQGYDFHQ